MTVTAWVDGIVEMLYASFEAKFARMQYAGNQRFHLSFMRHTGQWMQLYFDLVVNECIETIRDNPYFSL